MTYSESTGGQSLTVRAVITAILQVWPSAKIDRADPAGVWFGSVSDLTAEQIRHGISLIARSTERYPTSPGQFRALALSWRAPAPKPVQEVGDYSERTKAWRACQVRFAMRLCGQAPMKAPDTDFDVQSVVDAVYWDDAERQRAIKEGFGATHRFDQRLFDQLKREFEGAFV